MSWTQVRQIGNARVTSLTDGLFRLDGGALFGSVPLVVWSRGAGVDDLNRVQLRITPLLIQLNGENILVETGMWDQGDETFEARLDLQRDETVFRGLAALGLSPEDIHLVIHTHLHFDHAGRNVTGLGDPTFPRARHVVQRQELHDARHTHERSRASYVPGTFEPLAAAGLFELIDGPHELRPGLSVLPLPGHTLGQQGVVLRRGSQTLVYAADLIATRQHVPDAYIPGVDLYPMTSLETRKHFLPQWFEEGALICTPHDLHTPFLRLQARPRGGFIGVPDVGPELAPAEP